MRPKGSAEALEMRRMIAVRMLQAGRGVREVSRLVGVSPASVSRWKKVLQEQGVEALRAKPHPGRPPRLTADQKQRLAEILRRGARAAGFPTDLWTLRRVAQVIQREFEVQYHPGRVWYLLRGMGWSPQKPQRRARERDEEAIRTWRTQKWEEVKKYIAWYWLSMFFWGVGYGVRDEVEEGVIESLLATPASVIELLAAKAIDTLLINLYITIALVILLWLSAGVSFHLNWIKFFLLFMVSNFALASLSFVYAAFVLVARQASFAGNLFQEAVGILSGMTAPVSVLPKAVRWLSMLIPLTYAIEGARKVAVGQFPYSEMAILFAFGGVLLLSGVLLVKKAEHYVRLTGTTGEY
jgi:transposase/ABC-type polysaccharide/polyol phosphate export permease